MQRAFDLVKEYNKSQSEAALETGIPKSTIQKYLKSNSFQKIRKGASTILTTEEEVDLLKWIADSSEKGYCPR